MKDIREQLLDIFAGDEPEYDRAAALGVKALPVLREMVDEDEDTAARAVYVAGLMGVHGSLDVIRRAARRKDPVRIYAAGALREFAQQSRSPADLAAAVRILLPLLSDNHESVRRFAERAARSFPPGPYSHLLRCEPSS